MKRAWMLAALFAVGCKSGPSEDQCKQLLDHLVDLEFKKAGAGASSDQKKTDIAKQKTAVGGAEATKFIEQCTKKTSKARVECALAANEIDGENGVSKCDAAK